MSTEKRHTQNLDNSIREAIALSKRLGIDYVGSEHVLYGLAKLPNSLASKILNGYGVRAEQIERILAGERGREKIVGQRVEYTPNTNALFQEANNISNKIGVSYVSTEHLLLALLLNTDCYACKILRGLKVDLKSIYQVTLSEVNKPLQVRQSDPAVKTVNGDLKPKQEQKEEQFGIDLVQRAKHGKIDPVIGREEEITRVIRTLSRRTKNSPLLIGEAGVGKSAIVEGLALAVANGKVPETLRGKQIISIDLASLVAGAEYRGEFEKRLKGAINQAVEGGAILFIDEIHNIVGSGATSNGGMDAGEILKPQLARGELQIIGATTFDEYRKYIERDPALERRFQPITVNPPSTDATKQILRGIREKYEAHHRVIISDEAIDSAVMLSERYITDRNLPDKAIDVIDEAAARARINVLTSDEKITELYDKLDRTIAEREYAFDERRSDKVALLDKEITFLREQIEIQENLNLDKRAQSRPIIKRADVAQIISEWTNVPITKIGSEESEMLMNLEAELHKRIIGQERAVSAVSRAVRRARANVKDPNRPNGSFMFVGPTGVGKSELSKALAECVFGDKNALIRIDMSEYMERSDVSKLIGSAPGLVGYEEEGQLTEKVRRNPYSVVLFDEIEKAHPDIFNLMLQILDDGRLTDNKGRTVDFKNTIIIMTSNVGAGVKQKNSAIGFGQSELEQDAEDEAIYSALKQHFKPEFLNRIDDVITFRKLTQEECGKILKLLLNGLKQRLSDQGITLITDVSAEQLILEKGFNQDYGARPLRRAIQREIEDLLSDWILSGKIRAGNKVEIYGDNGSIKYTIL